MTEKTPDGSILENALTVGGPLACRLALDVGRIWAEGPKVQQREALLCSPETGSGCSLEESNAKITNRQGRKGNEKQHENDSGPFGAL